MSSGASRYVVFGCLIFAGEAIFSLPFHIARYFRAPTLDVFGLTNAQLGDAFAVYGITAMIAYFPGGPIADRYPARKLMAFSLVATGAGGLYLATMPSPGSLALLYGYWGVTSILLFWAAMIRTTREWGGVSAQGRAFGILDGGRGLIAAGLASLAVVVFAAFIREGAEVAGGSNPVVALRAVIYFYTAITVVAGVFCWILIPDGGGLQTSERKRTLEGIGEVLRTPSVWLQALIVFSAYVGYKGLDNYSLYAVQVLGMTDLEAARFTAATAYIRPVAAVGAGLLADRLSGRHVIRGLFVAALVGYVVLAQIGPSGALVKLIYTNLLLTYFAVFGLRGVYFAMLEETRVPSLRTGTAVGLISVVGYMPDFLFAPIAGRLLDRSPGLLGHQHVFTLLAGVASLGVIAVLLLGRATRHRRVEAVEG